MTADGRRVGADYRQASTHSRRTPRRGQHGGADVRRIRPSDVERQHSDPAPAAKPLTATPAPAPAPVRRRCRCCRRCRCRCARTRRRRSCRRSAAGHRPQHRPHRRHRRARGRARPRRRKPRRHSPPRGQGPTQGLARIEARYCTGTPHELLNRAIRDEVLRKMCWSGWARVVRGGHSSVQLDGRVEVPGSADFNHVELAGQGRRERWVGPLAFHDAPYRFIDFRHATGDNESH